MKPTLIAMTIMAFACGVEAQNAKPSIPEPTLPHQVVRVEKVPDFIPPFLAANIALPIQCDADGVAYVRLASTQAVVGILSVSPDGKKVQSFSSDKIIDHPNVRLGAFYPSGSGISVLVTWIEQPRKEKVTLVAPGGEKETTEITRGDERSGLARFDADGTYHGTITLDLPIQPMQFASFPSGRILVVGRDPRSGESKVATASSGGVFERYVDVFEKSRADAKHREPEHAPSPFAKMPEASIAGSQLLQTATSILLIRKQSNAPIYEISESGEVREIPVHAPEGSVLHSLIPSDKFWIARFIKRLGDGAGVSLTILAIDPSTGEQLEEFVFSEPVGYALACFYNGSFSAFKRENDMLLLLRGTPK